MVGQKRWCSGRANQGHTGLTGFCIFGRTSRWWRSCFWSKGVREVGEGSHVFGVTASIFVTNDHAKTRCRLRGHLHSLVILLYSMLRCDRAVCAHSNNMLP